MDVTKVVEVRSDAFGPCPYCDVGLMIEENTDTRINHYLKEHGLKLLHVGTESSWAAEGTDQKMWYSTVAILGE